VRKYGCSTPRSARSEFRASSKHPVPSSFSSSISALSASICDFRLCDVSGSSSTPNASPKGLPGSSASSGRQERSRKG
jgi:hypothetical protein